MAHAPLPFVDVVGRFPPPLDGQALATARLADLLAAEHGGPFHVGRHDVGAPEDDHLVIGGGLPVRRAAHFLRLQGSLRRALQGQPGAPVLWPSISPSPLGHARDLATVVPAFGPRPVVGVVHRGDFGGLLASPLTRASGRWLIDKLSAVVFLTEGLAAASGVPEAKRVVIPNTIDDATIPTPAAVRDRQQRRAARAVGAPLRLLYLSGMIPSKGYAAVLDATAELRDRAVPVRTTFAGRWPTADAEAAFNRRIAALGLREVVDVRGGVGRPEAAALMSDADVLVLPTTYPAEAQPLVVIEAFAAGTPVVATPHAGLPEMVCDGRDGVLAAPDPDRLADALERIAASWLAFSAAARERFDAAYSPPVVRSHWVALLDRLVGPAP